MLCITKKLPSLKLHVPRNRPWSHHSDLIPRGCQGSKLKVDQDIPHDSNQVVRIPITFVITYTMGLAIYISLCLFDRHLTFHPYHFVTPLSPTSHNCIFRLFNIRGSEGVVHSAKLQQVSKNYVNL